MYHIQIGNTYIHAHLYVYLLQFTCINLLQITYNFDEYKHSICPGQYPRFSGFTKKSPLKWKSPLNKSTKVGYLLYEYEYEYEYVLSTTCNIRNAYHSIYALSMYISPHVPNAVTRNIQNTSRFAIYIVNTFIRSYTHALMLSKALVRLSTGRR